MTNREYLATLSNYDLSNYIYTFLVPVIGKSNNNSVMGVAEWLGQEHNVPYWTPSLTIGDDYIETAPKQATWVLYGADFYCSKCGFRNRSDGFPATCPNCGSKIKGVDDGCNY